MGGDNTEKKTTIMVLKVDLECSSCCKKVKKVLCKFPQIRDQVYNEKANTITIRVLCCNPERIRDKLCCKGGGVIKSIEIKEPPTPKPPEKPTQPKDEKPKKQEPVDTPESIDPTQPKDEKPKKNEPIDSTDTIDPSQPKDEKPKKHEPVDTTDTLDPGQPRDERLKASKRLKEPEKPKVLEKPREPVQGYPRGNCCEQCYGGYMGGPCYHNWYGRPVQPVPPVPCYDYSYGYGPAPGQYTFPKSCCVNKCEYFSEENASGCSIM